MKLLIKNALLKIKGTIGRFLSLFFIIALGLGFFSGVKETSKDMYITANKYYDDNKLYDYKIVSTYGMSNDDIESLKKLENVETVEGAYFVDVLVESKVYRMHSILDNMNKFVLKEGRMPLNDNECLAENGVHKIGDTIKISSNEYLKNTEFKVVGLIESPVYIGTEKGISNIGNGKLSSFVYLNKEAFKMDFFTEAYLIGKGTSETNSYSDEYENEAKKIYDELKELKPIRETIRYEEILEEATKEITKNEDKIKNEELKNRNKLKVRPFTINLKSIV